MVLDNRYLTIRELPEELASYVTVSCKTFQLNFRRWRCPEIASSCTVVKYRDTRHFLVCEFFTNRNIPVSTFTCWPDLESCDFWLFPKFKTTINPLRHIVHYSRQLIVSVILAFTGHSLFKFSKALAIPIEVPRGHVRQVTSFD